MRVHTVQQGARVNRTEEALEDILDWVSDHGFDLGGMDKLEVFAGDGSLATDFCAERFRTAELWEIDPAKCERLRRKYATAVVHEGDSIARLRQGHFTHKYDLISVDNPLGVYGPGYCEHFEALPLLLAMLKPRSVIVLDVVPHPYNHADHPEWMQRRGDYYGVESPNAQDIHIDYMTQFYTEFFTSHGWFVDAYAVPRESHNDVEYFWYIAFVLQQA